MDKLKFLSGDEPAEVEEPGPDAPVVETPPAPEPAPQPDPEPAPEPKAPPPIEPGHVPISAMLDEREKRQALEKQLAQFKAEAQPPPPLDATQQLSQALYAQNLRTSRRFAETQYGAESVAKVHDWATARCDADPFFNEKLRASDHPYEDAMQAFNREQIVAEVSPSDLEAFRAWKAANGQVQAAHTQPNSSLDAPPPRSLVNAAGTGALGRDGVPVGQGEAHRALFKG